MLLFRARPIRWATGPANELGGALATIGTADAVAIGAIALLVLLVGITALVSPPNTWDAIDYHLNRVALWISNRGVQFFPTLDYDQLVNPPWAEYAMLHLYLLFGTDRLVNLVEWFSLIGSILCASLIARELGAGFRGQVLAAITCGTIPSALLEASGAMNTAVVAFWIAACAYNLLRFSKEGSWYYLNGAAIACGLALLTKGTAYLFLPPMIAVCWWMGSPACRSRFIVRLPVFAVIILSLNALQLYRTLELTGSPLGRGIGLLEGGEGLDLATGRLSLSGTLSNVLRNLTLDVTVTKGLDDYAGRAASRVIRLLGDEPNDPDFIYRTLPELPVMGFHANSPNRNEVFAGNPLHLLFVLLAMLLSLLSIRSAPRYCFAFAIGLIGAFLLFSALVRWQIWGARYQVALFVLGSGLIGAELPRYFGRMMTTAIATVFILAATPFVLSNNLRPLIGASLSPSRLFREPFAGSIWSRTRADLYFADQHQDLEDSYMAAADAIGRNRCESIGVDVSLEHYEYPLLAHLGLGSNGRRIRYVDVDNESAKYGTNGYSPCLAVCFECAGLASKRSEYINVGHRMSLYGNVAVFSSDGDVPNTAQNISIDSSKIELSSTIAEMQQEMLSLGREVSNTDSALYAKLLQRSPESELSVGRRFFAMQRPFYDGSRVWELTEPLRVEALTQVSSGIDPGLLLAGEEALRSFILKEGQARDDFAAYAAMYAKE
jgi:hypothetical protein